MTNAIESSTASYSVPEENLKELQTKLDKLSRKAAKLGVASISYTVGAASDVPFVCRRTAEGDVSTSRFDPRNGQTLEDLDKAGHIRYIRFFEVTVTGGIPRLAGFEFVATLQHLTEEGGETINLLRTVPGFEGSLPVEYRTATPENCDHCRRAIKTRKETFIVRETATGRFMQVGRSCTQAFLGGQDPHAVTAALEALLQACSAASDAEQYEGGPRGEYRQSLSHFLAVTAMLVRSAGWTSRGKSRASDGVIRATADIALEYLNPPRDGRALADWKAWVAANPVLPEDIEVAEKSLEFAQNLGE